MYRYGAEGACTVASAMGGDGVPDRLHRLHMTVLGVIRVDGVLVIRSVDGIQLLRGHGTLGAFLDEVSLTVSLTQVPPGDWIAVVVE